MKKLASIIFVLLFVFGISACTSTDDAAVVSGGGGNAILSAAGGASTGGYGGYGGYLNMYTYSANGVKILRGGSADATFTVPSDIPETTAGSLPVTVAASATVKSYATSTVLALNELALFAGNSNLYQGDGVTTMPTGTAVVTSLKVNAGVTLTIEPNTDNNNYDNDANHSTGADSVEIGFANDVDIAGTVTTAALTTAATSTPDQRHGGNVTARDKARFSIWTNNVYSGIIVRSTGAINTAGANGAADGQRGGDGGLVDLSGWYILNLGTINASGGNAVNSSPTGTAVGGSAGVDYNGSVYITLYAWGGQLVNKGSIIGNGGNGSDGGTAAELQLISNIEYDDMLIEKTFLVNSGTIQLNGGAGSNGDGGSAVGVNLVSVRGNLFNSGSISSKGGNGTTAGGDGSGENYFVAVDNCIWNWCYNGTGNFINSGAMDFSGGNATDSATSADGGEGGSAYIYAAGEITSNANLTANGGNGMLYGSGGTAGGFGFYSYQPYDSYDSIYLPIKAMNISGNIVANGGTSVSGWGGTGGWMEFQQDDDSGDVMNWDPPTMASAVGGINLLGYASASVAGGNGSYYGGNNNNWPAISVQTYMTSRWTMDSNSDWVTMPMSAGPITNEISMTAAGGSASAAWGYAGYAGYIDFGVEFENYDGNTGLDMVPLLSGISVIKNSGALNASGGAATGSGGYGGSGMFVEFSAPDSIENTGAITGTGGNSNDNTGGYGAWVQFMSRGDINNTATINTAGGSGAYGSGGGWMNMQGSNVTTPGALIANGGSGSTSNGDGGLIILNYTTTWGTTNVAAGTGAGSAGDKGDALINLGYYDLWWAW